MKSIIKNSALSVLIALTTFFSTLHAASLHHETATFKVYGNCEMCKKRIETALLKNNNIQKATWDVQSKTLTVVYDPHMISLENIHKIVASVGHDTDKLKAEDNIYNALPGCCQYKRQK